MSPRPPKSAKSPAAPQSRASSYLANIELKQRILTSLSKLSDRDTHSIAVEDLEKIIHTLPPDSVPMMLNCLFDASVDPKNAIRKESVRLLSVFCFYNDSALTHLGKIICHIVKRLQDSDSGIKDSCRVAIGSLSAHFLKGERDSLALGSLVSLFTKPLFEALNDQSKGVQSGAAMCIAKMVECASTPPLAAFQKLCLRICKFFNNPNFQAKASLLPVVGTLSQVGAIAPQSIEILLHCIHKSLSSQDWTTRKAAADALCVIALHSRSLITDKVASTLKVLEASRFDKIKPARDSVLEALQLWKEIAGETNDTSGDHKTLSNRNSQIIHGSRHLNSDETRGSPSREVPSNGTSVACDLAVEGKSESISSKTIGILKTKVPALLSDKELNPDFFQKLKTRGSGDLPVEVIVPRGCFTSSDAQNDEETGTVDTASGSTKSNHLKNSQSDDGHESANLKYGSIEGKSGSIFSKEKNFNTFVPNQLADERDGDHLETGKFDVHGSFSKTDVQSDGSFTSNKGNWLSIQRQLLQLERQQTHLMGMLQDFMGGSHDSMLSLENRVRGLERVVEDMTHDLSISSSRRGTNFMMRCEAPSTRPSSKFNGFSDYSGSKFGKGCDNGRISYSERFSISGRTPCLRSDFPQAWNSHSNTASRTFQIGSRRVLNTNHVDQDSDHHDARPVRLGEGPSARSVWRASKDEATLEAIRIAGEDNGKSKTLRLAVPELNTEVEEGGNGCVQERDPVWTCWNNAIGALRAGDTDSAYAEVLSSGDDFLLVRLMDRSGPVLDQLSNGIATGVLLALGNFLVEPNLFDICLSWIQQLVEIVMENGADVVRIPEELKREVLWNLQECCSTMEPPEDWEGASSEFLALQLASAWGINPQHVTK